MAIALQPIVDARVGRVVAYEALLRGYEEIGFNSVPEVLSHAQSVGVLLDLELEIHRRAVDAFKRAPRDPGTLLFVNLDARNAGDLTKVCSNLDQALRKNGFRASDICVELSESNQDLSRIELESQTRLFREHGFRVAVDDYGSGSSGLQMLYHSHPDFLKIDRFFVNGIEDDARKRLFVGSVVDLAHTLGMTIVAEGVETIAELQRCHDIRCDLVQGYIVARPTIDMGQLLTSYPLVPQAVVARSSTREIEDIRNLLEPYRWMGEDALLTDVLKLFRDNPTQSIIPVVDTAGRPRGVIREVDIKPFLYSPFGRDLLVNPASGFRLPNFLRLVPTADVTSDLRYLIETYQDRLQDGVLVTEGQKYVGYLPASALVRIINNIRLDEARGANPLTRLPGNEAISGFLADARANAATDRLLCYFDFDNFKPFNDTYGFRVGDRAILMFRDILAAHFGNSEVFVGHVGGDDFFAGAIGPTIGKLMDSLATIRAEFAHSVSSLYTLDDRKRGFILGTNRSGETACWSLMTCSIAVLHLKPGSGQAGVDEIAGMIANLKRQAKAATDGIARQVVEVGHGGEDPNQDRLRWAC